MPKASFILCLLLLIIRHSLAQSSISIRGLVEDSAGAALPNATVLLIIGQDSLSSITKNDGHFKIILSQVKPFELLVTMKGYIPYKQRYVPDPKGSSLDLKSIKLQNYYRELDPVIVSKVNPISIGQDTLTYHAGAFVMRDGAEVEALLKRLPGVEVDQDGNVIVQGKKVVKVMVDGKLFFGGDVLTATRNLPAEIVDKLQVIDDYGDKARLTGIKSGEVAKVLNIVLKQDKRNGQFGRVEGGIGNQGKYTGNIFGNSFGGDRQLAINIGVKNNDPSGENIQKSSGFSYANRWGPAWKGEGNISLIGTDPHSSGSMIQDNYFSDGRTHQEQSTQTTASSRNTNLGSTLTYSPDNFHTLRVSPSLIIQHSQQAVLENFLTTQQLGDLIKINNGHSLSKTGMNNYSVGSELYYEQLSRHSKKRFSTQVKASYYDDKQQNDNHLYTTVELSSERSVSEQHYLINNSNPAWSLGVATNYFIPLGKTGFLEFGYNWHNSKSHKKRVTMEQDSLHINPAAIDSLRQDYIYHSMEHDFHGGYTAGIHNLSLTITLDAQPGNFNGNTTSIGKNIRYQYFNWMPNLQVSYNFTKSNRLFFQYNESPSLPSLEQVQPVTDLTNPQYLVKGNPNIRPAYTQSASLHYEQSFLKPTKFWGFGADIGYNVTQNTIIQNIVHPKDGSTIIQITSFLNAGNCDFLNAGYHLNLPAMFQKKLKIILNGQLTSSSTIVMTDSILYNTASLNINQNIHLQFTIPDYIELDLSGNYDRTHAQYSADAGSRTNFSSARWSLSNRHYFWRRWILNYQLSQSYTSIGGHGLHANPSYMTASLQRKFLRKNRATVSVVGYNLFNTNSGITQSFSATNVTTSQVALTSRYFFIQFFLNWNKFNEY